MDKQKIKQDRIYIWLEDLATTAAIPLILLFMFSLLVFMFFWAGCVTSESSESCNRIMDMNFVIPYGISFMVLLEIIYVWICRNQKTLKDDDVLPIKIIAFACTSLIINLIVPLIYGTYLLISTMLLKVVMIILAIVIGCLGLYVFYLLNKRILIIIRENRR